MEYLVITLKAIAAYFVLMLIGVNLIGFVVRGFMLADTVTNNETAKEIYGKSSIALPIVSMLFLIGYLYALYHFFNIWVLISGIILMITRIPDLLWEIRHGKKITLRDMPKNFSDMVLNILSWAVLLLLWYAFYIN